MITLNKLALLTIALVLTFTLLGVKKTLATEGTGSNHNTSIVHGLPRVSLVRGHRIAKHLLKDFGGTKNGCYTNLLHFVMYTDRAEVRLECTVHTFSLERWFY